MHAHDLLHALPVPADLDQPWRVFVQLLDRSQTLADQVAETDQDKFDTKMKTLAASDTQLQQFSAQISEADQKRIRAVRNTGPCDPSGLPTGFGCTDPKPCTEQWVAAESQNDQVAVGLLGSVRIALPTAVGATLTVGGCSPSPDYPDGTRCNVSGDKLQGYVDWFKTSDGRWYGIDAEMSRFVPVGSAIS